MLGGWGGGAHSNHGVQQLARVTERAMPCPPPPHVGTVIESSPRVHHLILEEQLGLGISWLAVNPI